MVMLDDSEAEDIKNVKREAYFETTEKPKNPDFTPNAELKRYKETNILKYPMMILETDELKVYRVQALKTIVRPSQTRGKREDIYDVSHIYTYLRINGDLVELGEIEQDMLKDLLTLDVYAPFTKELRLTEVDIVKDKTMMLAFCSMPD